MIREIFSLQKRQSLLIKKKTTIDFLSSTILLIPLLLVVISSLLIFSIQRQYSSGDAINHLFTGFIGCIVAILISYIPLERIKNYIIPFYLLAVTSLLLVYFFGISIYGAQRWLSIGLFSFQPSEIAKLSTLLFLALVLDSKIVSSLKDLLLPFVVTIVPWMLIFFQPDLGTSLVLIFLFLVMLYWARMPVEWILIIIFCFFTAIFAYISKFILIFWLPFVGYLGYKSFQKKRLFLFIVVLLHSLIARITPFLWNYGLKDYQKDRLILFIEPGRDPLGGGYHLIQSKIAIGSGGLFGTGFLQGKLTNLQFIPEQHTDFIFSAVGEELGFIGSFFVVFLFFVLIMYLIKISKNARTSFESFLIIGVASIFLFQIIINIYMTIGLGPVTGIPLPFMSYGRTSLIVNFIFIGFVLSTIKRSRSMRKI